MLIGSIHLPVLNSNQTAQSQAASSKQAKRRVNHFDDMDGGEIFDRIPRKLMRAFIDNEMPVPKFRLICSIIVHSENFQIRCSYLRKRFSPTILKKYLPEIKKEGYVTVDERPISTGRYENIYHVNPIKEWALYKSDTPPSAGCKSECTTPPLARSIENSTVSPLARSIENCSQSNGSIENGIRKPGVKETKVKETNVIKTLTISSETGEGESKGNITKTRLVGEWKSMFQFASTETCRAHIEYLENDCRFDKQVILGALMKAQKTQTSQPKKPTPEHRKHLEKLCADFYSSEPKDVTYEFTQEEILEDDNNRTHSWDLPGVL